MKKKRKYLLFI